MILLKVLNNLNSDEDYYEYENEDLIIYNDIKKDLEVTDNKYEIKYFVVNDDEKTNIETIKDTNINKEEITIFLDFVLHIPCASCNDIELVYKNRDGMFANLDGRGSYDIINCEKCKGNNNWVACSHDPSESYPGIYSSDVAITESLSNIASASASFGNFPVARMCAMVVDSGAFYNADFESDSIYCPIKPKKGKKRKKK